ncbi:MAG: sugar phosphate isomerase/epimerase [Oscillospiraceae bacterium]|nr:sugar phosphate isomerase/epimerase [Oscillospiraceae bacterium]
MKIGVSSYSFAKLKKEATELIAMAKELDFAAIEYTDMDCPDRETAQALAEESARVGLPIICYTIGADFLQTDSLDEEIARVKDMVDIAEILGVKLMRHDASRGFGEPQNAHNSWAQALPILARACREVTEYAAAKDIATMVENHGYFCQDSVRVAQLVGEVNHPNFGVLADMGNFCCADEDPAIACGNVGAMTKHVHAKDFHIKPGNTDNPGEGWFHSRGGNFLRGAVIGHGDVPIRQCLGNFARAGYDGYVSIEFEGMEDPMVALRIGRSNLERFCE